MAETVVVNCKTEQYDVLIDRTTIFGNPFKVWQWGREGCIAKFREYFYNRIERDTEWKAKVLELRGKRLGCHCKRPDREVGCHGDVYKEYLDAYEWLERMKLIPQLKELWADIDRLATSEGWYDPELQGEAIYRLAMIDNDVARNIVAKQISDADYDVLGAILSLIKEAKSEM